MCDRMEGHAGGTGRRFAVVGPGTKAKRRQVGPLALLTALALLALTASPASAGISMQSSITMPSATAAGQQDVNGSFTLTNINTPPNESESLTVTVMKLAPTCGATSTVSDLCPSPDPGNFALSPTATGGAGTACAGSTFSVSAPDASGIVTFTRNGGPLVLPPPGATNNCTVNFIFDVLGIPAIDVDPGIANTQTRTNLLSSAHGINPALVVSNRPSLMTTVVRAAATLATNATDGVVGEPIRDTATLTSGVPGGPTGTVTFSLYGPGDTNCTGSTVFVSPNRPLSGGSATSSDYNPPAAGAYRWRASYSGDAEHLPLNAPCNSLNETSTVTLAAPLTPTSMSAEGDFNGDGIGDLAIGAPGEDMPGGVDAGVVHVLYGGSPDMSAAGSQFWHQDSPGIADSIETGDGFGSSLATGDLNGDGRDDLAIGARSEDLGAVADAGVVHVIYGSAAGLTATGSQYWNQNSGGVVDAGETGDRFGSALATGKLNNDAFAELVVGVPGESVGAVAGAGVVHVLPGAAAGVTAAGSQYWHQNAAGIADAVEAGDAFGASLAVGDMNSVVGQDLAVGAPAEGVGAFGDAGVVHVIFGSAGGLTSAGSQYWNQNSAGVADATETGDRFGSALTTGKLDNDAFSELVVGVPDEGIAAVAAAGVVHVLPGAAAGLTATGSQYWNQNSAGIAEIVEAGDGFGSSLATGAIDSVAGQDLAIGVPAESIGAFSDAGAVHVIFGSAGGLTSAGSQYWNQNSAGIADATENGDRFGSALSMGKFNSATPFDLAIGVSDESVGAAASAGVVQILPGVASGLSATGSQYWNQNSAGIADVVESGDGFGAALGT